MSVAELISAIPVATLDLHGSTAAEAERRVESFLRSRAGSSGGKVVEIVTGKGTRSAGPAVLPRVVRAQIDGPLSHLVSEWAGAMGGGAVRVRLRRTKRRKGA